MKMAEISELKRIASQVRRDVIRMVHNVGNGHPGGALGCTDLFVLLYFKHMEHNKEFSMDGLNEDLFFLSNGHISAVFYSTLARAGYFPVEELNTHRKIDSRLQGHPTPYEHLEGIRMASGSLGQGLSVAIGAAETKRLNKEDKNVYALMGDGEQQEGQIWEAAMYAAHNKLDNLIGFVDYNLKQIDGSTDDVLSLGDLAAKYKAFGWEVFECNGNDMEELDATVTAAKAAKGNGKPKMVLMRTEMGYPIDFMVGTHKWHGVAPNAEQTEIALAQLEETLGDF
ncbi:transketolase [Limibacter armeniacum]|uniref:transketolase n=1 Tax=Limibacter armeniacum TaxID=466084 RepID=UPI002FE52241